MSKYQPIDDSAAVQAELDAMRRDHEAAERRRDDMIAREWLAAERRRRPWWRKIKVGVVADVVATLAVAGAWLVLIFYCARDVAEMVR